MDPSTRRRHVFERNDVDHIKVGDVEDLDGLVARRGRQQRAVVVDRHGGDGIEVRSKVLGELDALGLLLPELDVAVDAASDDEVAVSMVARE